VRPIRMLLASLTVASLAPVVAGSPLGAHAGGHIGTAKSDFTQVTPANAVLYSTVQSTYPDQPANLRALGKVIAPKFNIQALVNQVAGSSSGGTSALSAAIVSQIVSGLGNTFNGELGLAVLPLSVSRSQSGKPTAKLHLLLDAGLQPGVGAQQLATPLSLLGSRASSSVRYRNLLVITLDLRSLLGSMGGSMHSTTRHSATSPLSGVFYGTVAGNVAVLASDLPTLRQAIDTWFGAAPSIASLYDFHTTISALPAHRLLSTYVHIDTEQIRPFVTTFAGRSAAKGLPRAPGTLSGAFAVTAEPDGILMSASPLVRIGSLATGQGLPATNAGEPSILPANTLVYAALNDPGTLIRRLVETLVPRLQGTSSGHIMDPIQALKLATGLNIDNDVLSWMHGDASLALLPVGSKDFGAGSPTTSLSLVATLRVPNQALVEAKLLKINAALQAIPNSGAAALKFVEVPTASGNPLNMLALTPSGVGFTFYHGYLIVGTALPADYAAMQQASAGKRLAASPLYTAALGHFGAHRFGMVFYVNVTKLRQTSERIAAAMGTDLRPYRRGAQPLLSAFTSVSAVAYAGPNAGGAVFLGIGR
jgi:hypothetical protein